MNRRFRPFYVAAFAVVMVGLYGTEAVPKSHKNTVPESVSVQVTAPADEGSEWLGPQENATPGLLDLTGSFSILPLSVAQ